MPAQKPTPEEKLFAVIQGAAGSSPRARTGVRSLATLIGRFAIWIGPVDLPRVNRALVWAIAAVFGACLLSLIALRPQVNQVVAEATQQASPFVIAGPLDGLQDTDHYVRTMTAQDPFRVGAEPATGSGTTTTPVEVGVAIKSVLADLRLVGISWGEVPVAMIEQTSAKQTYFLKTGDPIGRATIKEILKDRVILDVDGQEAELY